MHVSSSEGNDATSEIDRLTKELEQAKAALEQALDQGLHLASERNEALATIARQRGLITTSELTAERLRQELAGLVPTATQSPEPDSKGETLRSTLDEGLMLAKELAAANEALSRANRELDARVIERTHELETAKVELERLNLKLSQQVQIDTEALARAQAELFQVRKLDAIGKSTGGIAHDFNNLLTVVVSGLQMIGPALKDDPKRARIVRRTEEAAWRGADLTRHLLTFARRQPLHPDRVDLDQHLEGLRELLAHSLRADIRITTHVESGLWPVEADIGALELALLKLAVNARDAMPAGGELTLSARNSADGNAMDKDLPPGDYIELCVRDTGTGMEREVLERAFEPFFTTKGKGKGTGLGLSQVYGFAKQSGGTAFVRSEPGTGTEVFMLLPRSSRSAPQPATKSSAVVADEVGQLAVLVVEDDDDLASAILDMLGQLGHSGTRVATVPSALAILAGDEPISLVFSDVVLPGGSGGLDLAREMQRRGLGVPLILTSGYGGELTRKLASASFPFLRKPCQVEALNRAIIDAVRAPQVSIA